MAITVQFELRKGSVTQDSGLMQFSDVHELNKYIRQQCMQDFWYVAKSSFKWTDLPSTFVMDLEEDKFALKGVDWQLGQSYITDYTYHVVGM